MTDAAEEIIAEVVRIAGTLGLPVDVDRPYALDEKDLPLVVVGSGEEEAVEDDDMPAEAWDLVWRIEPTIGVFLRVDDPLEAHATMKAHWQTLRQELRAARLDRLCRQGSKPGIRREAIALDGHPDLTGFQVTLAFEIERFD